MAAEKEEMKFPGKDGMSRFMQIDMEHKEKLSYHGKGAMPRYVVPPAPESDARFRPGIRTITEAQREVEVLCEADVVVVGGGPGGFAAAASSRAEAILESSTASPIVKSIASIIFLYS